MTVELCSRPRLAGLTIALSCLVGCATEESPNFSADTGTILGGGDAAQLPEAGFPGGGFGGNPSGGPGGTAGGGADGGSEGDAIPGEVCGVLQRNGCVDCHQTVVEGGAPMPLSLASHFKGNALDGSPLAQRVLARVVDPRLPMPPQSFGLPAMSATDLATLKGWIDGGSRGVAGGECPKVPRTGSDDPDQVPPWATAPWPTEECEYVMQLGAHGAALTPVANDPTPYPVPADLTNYHCFYEKVPWGDKKVQALAMRAIIESPDDKALVHHFVVSGVEPINNTVAGARPAGPGDHKNCMNPNGSTMAVWAPGAINPLTYPSDVGLLLPSGDSYIELQVHYNNASRLPGKQSRVRYEICATSKLRPQTAGVFWLGYENAFYDTLITGKENSSRLDNQNNGTAVGRCEAKTKGRILSIMPHMHQRGVHSKFEVVRKNGTTETVVDAPYSFSDERSYFKNDFRLEPGDAVRSTCRWDKGPVYFGFGTDAEMCFFYTLAYPIEVFKAGPTEKGLVGGDLACAHNVFP